MQRRLQIAGLIAAAVATLLLLMYFTPSAVLTAFNGVFTLLFVGCLLVMAVVFILFFN